MLGFFHCLAGMDIHDYFCAHKNMGGANSVSFSSNIPISITELSGVPKKELSDNEETKLKIIETKVFNDGKIVSD